MSDHFDTLETRDPELRERAQIATLRTQIGYARAHAPWFGRALTGIEPEAIDSRSSLSALPVVRKSEQLELQKADLPFGGFAPSAGFLSNRPARTASPNARFRTVWR